MGAHAHSASLLQDDKGGLITALAALEACLKGTGRLPVNVKVSAKPCILFLSYLHHSALYVARMRFAYKNVYPICMPLPKGGCVKKCPYEKECIW